MTDAAEVPDADSQEQHMPVDPEPDAAPMSRTSDPEAPEADAQEQAMPAPTPDIDEYGA